jgi:hypothetical protein
LKFPVLAVLDASDVVEHSYIFTDVVSAVHPIVLGKLQAW